MTTNSQIRILAIVVLSTIPSCGSMGSSAWLTVTSPRVASTRAYRELVVDIGSSVPGIAELKTRFHTLLVLRLRERNWFEKVGEGRAGALVLRIDIIELSRRESGWHDAAFDVSLVDGHTSSPLGTARIESLGSKHLYEPTSTPSKERAMEEAVPRILDFIAESR